MLEFLVTPKIAQIAKLKGFNFPTNWALENIDAHRIIWCQENKNWNGEEPYISIPPRSQLKKWLRDVKKIHIEVHLDNTAETFPAWSYCLDYLDNCVLSGDFWIIQHEHCDLDYPNYEESLDQAILYALSKI